MQMAARGRWFHQNITGLEAQQLLMTRGRDGSFLCRPSGNKKDYTLSVRRAGSVTNIKIQNKGDQFDLYGGDPFPTLSSLIHHYMENNIPETNGEIIELRYPLNCEEPTTERWFHGNISNADATRLMNEKGKNGSYLVRESVTSPGNYVVTVKSDDVIKHVMIKTFDGKYFDGGTKFDSISKLVEHYRINPMVEKNGGTVVHLKQPLNSTKFMASSIGDRVAELKKENDSNKDGFWEEFEQLQQQEHKHEYSRRIGLSSENKQKNRFRNIVPYDHTRVVLRDCDPNDQKQSYINASYISGENDKEYIATQGCLPETILDFWRMIWLENTRVILLGNREIERGKSRCEKYWPDVENSLEVEKFTIFCNKETETQEFVAREFELRNNEEPDETPRTIYHYQYIAWPEHGIPENVGSVLGILHDINLKQKNNEYSGPIVFQCSNGVGRTATFIVIDILLKVLQMRDWECEIDIQKTVQEVRSQRRGMVQLEAQYKFIYLALAHFVEMEKHHINTSQQQQQFMPPIIPMQRNTPVPSPSRPMMPPPSISLNGEAPPPTPPPRNPAGHAPPTLFGMRQIKEPESPVPGTPPARPPPRMKKPT